MPFITPAQDEPDAPTQAADEIEKAPGERELWPEPIEGGSAAQVMALLRYLTQTDVHTYAFSVAANVILSLFPFIVLLLTLSQRVFHSPVMFALVGQLMNSYLPTGQDFVMRNMNLLVHPHKGVQFFSIVMLLVSSTGVFLPLEVALNNVWRAPKNRNYLHNQMVSLSLALSAGLPHLDFGSVYGPFQISVGLMLWAFLSGLMLLAGAHFSATRHAMRLAEQDREL